ncbi:helix-turn-helix domain-containing protein [Sphingomonas sp. KR1UV-12]|uniref:Helix-turn-helix domain-containing protein n=1 Tax=Sphingomonas aurea TaxID=3063994 RepID=A0ABT9EP28_9SPHN|nr:TetR/AcrR family transcriptional regulator [Sphingomonas sp. KR1UV-12]MDP1028580.1 helix-turn-helix domain-containing protein [Sphingomonas sp. KR1UV-12]
MKLLHCTNAARATRADARREHLLETARALFVQRGFHSTGVAQIAAASGVKVGQIYRDFQSKEDIIAAIVERDIEGFLHEACLAQAIDRGDRTAVRTWITRLLAIDEPIEDCRMMTEILAEIARNDRMAEINRRIERRVRDSLTTALASLAPAHADPARLDLLADFIMTIGTGLTCRRIASEGGDATALHAKIERIIDDELAQLPVEA